MKIQEVLCALERFAPLPLQEDYDNAGLQVGLTETWEVSGALLCLDVTEQVVDEAVEKGCNLIVSHHPLIFHKLARLTDENHVERTVMKAVEHHIAIISMHTNLDNARGGVNFRIAERLGLDDVRFFGEVKTVDGVDGASGVIGVLPVPVTAETFVKTVKIRMEAACVQANQLLERDIRTVAICGGAGSFLLEDAWKAGADAFLTGEMHYHEYFGWEQKIQIAVIGHYESEHFTISLLADIIRDACPSVRCCLTETLTNPIIYL